MHTDSQAEAFRVAPIRTIATDLPFDAQDLLVEAQRRSPTVRAQLKALESTDLIVLLELRKSLHVRTGCLQFVRATADFRVVRIAISAKNQLQFQIGWLGHELQHALEVSQAPEVRDDESLARFYERFGRPATCAGRIRYETDAALAAGRRVLEEVTRVR
jgi:hypothetical protein